MVVLYLEVVAFSLSLPYNFSYQLGVTHQMQTGPHKCDDKIWEQGAFWNLVSHSQSPGELLPLTCEPHKCFSVLPQVLGRPGWLEWDDACGASLLPGGRAELAAAAQVPCQVIRL